MTFYDIQKMFDSQWTIDTMNDMFDVCNEKDDKLSLLFEANRESYVAINTPFGKTSRITLKDIEMQGSVMGPIKAAINMDTIGKKMLQSPNDLYSYKT